MKCLNGCHLHPDFKAKRLEVGSEGAVPSGVWLG